MTKISAALCTTCKPSIASFWPCAARDKVRKFEYHDSWMDTYVDMAEKAQFALLRPQLMANADDVEAVLHSSVAIERARFVRPNDNVPLGLKEAQVLPEGTEVRLLTRLPGSANVGAVGVCT